MNDPVRYLKIQVLSRSIRLFKLSIIMQIPNSYHQIEELAQLHHAEDQHR